MKMIKVTNTRTDPYNYSNKITTTHYVILSSISYIENDGKGSVLYLNTGKHFSINENPEDIYNQLNVVYMPLDSGVVL